MGCHEACHASDERAKVVGVSSCMTHRMHYFLRAVSTTVFTRLIKSTISSPCRLISCK